MMMCLEDECFWVFFFLLIMNAVVTYCMKLKYYGISTLMILYYDRIFLMEYFQQGENLRLRASFLHLTLSGSNTMRLIPNFNWYGFLEKIDIYLHGLISIITYMFAGIHRIHKLRQMHLILVWLHHKQRPFWWISRLLSGNTLFLKDFAHLLR